MLQDSIGRACSRYCLRHFMNFDMFCEWFHPDATCITCTICSPSLDGDTELKYLYHVAQAYALFYRLPYRGIVVYRKHPCVVAEMVLNTSLPSHRNESRVVRFPLTLLGAGDTHRELWSRMSLFGTLQLLPSQCLWHFAFAYTAVRSSRACVHGCPQFKGVGCGSHVLQSRGAHLSARR